MDFQFDVFSIVTGITLYIIGHMALRSRVAFPRKSSKQQAAPEKEDCSLNSEKEEKEPNPEPQPEPELSDDEASVTLAEKPPATSSTEGRSIGKPRLYKIVLFCALFASVYFIDSVNNVPAAEPAKRGHDVQLPASDTLPYANVSSGDLTADRLPAVPGTIAIALQRQRLALHSGPDIVYYKIAYYGTMHLGTPAQSFTFVFDTGSGHVIVPSQYCHTDSCKQHKRFRRSASESAVDIDHDGSPVTPDSPRDQLTIQFGTGEVTGVFMNEKICMDEAKGQRRAKDEFGAPHVTAGPPTSSDIESGCMRMRVIAATEMSTDPFKTFNFDGILGLGLSSLSRTPEFNFMGELSRYLTTLGSMNPHMFSMFLGDGEEQSEMLFGGWSEERMQGGLHWNKVLHPEFGHWLINIKSIRVNDEIMPYCHEGCRAVVDSGTSLLSVPPPAFPEIYELLRHDAPQNGICQGRGPQFHIELDDFTITLGAEDYSIPEWYHASDYPPEFGERSSGATIGSDNYGPTRSDVYCRPMLMTMDIPEPVGPKLIILGEPVLRKYYTVYDTEEKRVGFGFANHKFERGPALVTPLDEGGDIDTWFFEDEEDDFL